MGLISVICDEGREGVIVIFNCFNWGRGVDIF